MSLAACRIRACGRAVWVAVIDAVSGHQQQCRQVCEFLRRQHQAYEYRVELGATIVVVTHELPSIYTIADRVIMLDKRTKSIIATGPPEELRDHSEDAWVRSFFRREVQTEAASA